MIRIGEGLDTLTEGGELMLGSLRQQVTQEFEGVQSFVLHLLAAELIWREQRKRALNAAATLIKNDARAQIGEYQNAVGNYPAWAELAESTEDQKARLGAPADAPLLRFGDLQKSFRSELDGEDAVIVGSTDPVMEYHEFGTSKMPPRPVLGPALYKNMEKIRDLLGHALLDTVLVGQRMGYRFDAERGGIAQPNE
jgi:HK97 gp10 family phage protein